MLTPRFELSQNDESVTVTIYAPNARLQDTEVDVNDNILFFTSTPYFLRLHFPHCLKNSEDERGCTASLDADRNAYIVVCAKQQVGQCFPGLDMLTSLLTPKSVQIKPSIEVVQEGTGEVSPPAEGTEEEEEEDGNLELDWFEPQELPSEVLTNTYKYGFADSHSNIAAIKEGLYGVLDLPDPNNSSPVDRRRLRQEEEAMRFCEQHYLADLFEADAVKEHLDFVPDYTLITNDKVVLSSSENTWLLELPRRELLVEKGKEEAQVLVGLCSLLLSWSYNHRVTGGEECVTAAWNWAKLAPQLAWLDTPHSLVESVRVFARRCVVFPLVRHLGLVRCVMKDTETLLRLGRKKVLQCLLEMRHVFNKTENYYLLNDIYISEYCIWIQTIKDKKLAALADLLVKVELVKSDLGLHLDALEKIGRDMMKEEEERLAGPVAVATVSSLVAVATNTTSVTIPNSGDANTTTTTVAAPQVVGDTMEDMSRQLEHLTFHNPATAGGYDATQVLAALRSNSLNNNTSALDTETVSNDSDDDNDTDYDTDDSSSSDSSSSSDDSDDSSSSDDDDDDSSDDDKNDVDINCNHCNGNEPPAPAE